MYIKYYNLLIINNNRKYIMGNKAPKADMFDVAIELKLNAK